MVGLLRSMIPTAVGLELVLDRECPPVQADAAEIRQVVLSLVTNAYEAIGTRQGAISIKTGSVLADRAFLEGGTHSDDVQPDRYSLLEVADTGPGMDDPTRARIFEPFFTTKFIGRGLGLAAVHGIVRSHGGTIKVETAAGRRATFTVLLPRASSGSAEAGTV